MDARTILLEGHPLLFDGAMGTLYASRYSDSDCEQALRSHPERITDIHREYIASGVHAVKTDTFALSSAISSEEDCAASIHAAVEAVKAAGDAVIPFADLGPVPPEERHHSGEIFIRLCKQFQKEGITHFLIETLPSADGIAEAAAYLQKACPGSFLIVSFAADSSGMTGSGLDIRALIRETAALDGVAAVGVNCVCGPSHMLQMIRGLDTCGKPLSVMPNAGYPAVIGRRTVFHGQPDYFGSVMAELYTAGASILGGCCGTTPEHIRMMVQRVRKAPPPSSTGMLHAEPKRSVTVDDNSFKQKLDEGRRVIALEMDPPKDDDPGTFAEDARALTEAGADIITLADCPVGRPRADSSLLACRLHREYGVEVLPHMTCRDRNLNATKALLLGLSMEGVRNVLLVTGDPIPAEDRDDVRSVFNFNSRKLAAYVTGLNQTTLRHPFCLFGALNVNAVNFDIQLKLAQEKEENGIYGFLTQPLLSPEAEDNLRKARSVLKGKLLAGIYPVVSYRNAMFLNNEIAGIRVSPEIISRYENTTREEAEAIAVQLSVETAKRTAQYTDGVYLMTPFNRISLMKKILQGIREE